ncbi:proton-conducting transporter membrane subunit [Candidatus Nitronereus thalassa]|uniref:Proton-conducting transporter membrane subunit n=1 Tax=Candidatus Nitronereus thalassa TaxID=3020898 RepID=A0ABU3KAN1_9BACT|nr:proton-conducting transporter membrane subunit [Candidatus Nitronereus thalassa]MDT7043373.1 proton-conducting transporter membrane subunit [Candidatus Nitronereus thalassa]
MEWWSVQAMLMMATPVLGAALGTIFWSRPQAFKICGLLMITTTWLIVTVPLWMSGLPWNFSFFFMHLIILTGLLTILGQPPNKEASISFCLILLFTGLGLGYVASQGPSTQIVLSGIFGLLILMFIRHGGQSREIPWFAIGILVMGILALFLSLVLPDSIRTLTLLVPLIIVWPLLPVHKVFVASASQLPGMVPAFLAVLLPSLGLYGFINLLPVIPDSLFNLLWVLAIGSAIYGSFLALAQDSMDTLVAYAHMTLGAIVWWYAAVTQSVTPGAVGFLVGLNLVMCGLLLGNHCIWTRFGHIDLQISHGLARIMPRFSTLFVLFITAALGLPFFTIFSAFMEMMLGIASPPVKSLVVILLAWLMASWYFPRLMQQVLFGHPSPGTRSGHDLHHYEQVSLILLLALLIILGMAPSDWFGIADPSISLVQLSLGISQV